MRTLKSLSVLIVLTFMVGCSKSPEAAVAATKSDRGIASSASYRGVTNILSGETKAILARLNAPVEVSYYESKYAKEVDPDFAEVVSELLGEYARVSGGKLAVEKITLRPDTAAEDAAKTDGIQVTDIPNTGLHCLGLAVKCGTNKVALPSLAGIKVQLLEYQVTRCIRRAAFPSSPAVGILSSLPIWGTPAGEPGTANPRQAPWVLLTELKRDYQVRRLEPDAVTIPPEVEVLLLIHPQKLGASLQRAVDQFILRGGRLLAFLDPRSLLEENLGAPSAHRASVQPTGLEPLLAAWGISFDPAQAVADLEFATAVNVQGKAQRMPGVLTLKGQGLSTNAVLTWDIDEVLLPFAGPFSFKPVLGLRHEILLRSSTHSRLQEAAVLDGVAGQAADSFPASGKSFPLAIRVDGHFRSAFAELGATNLPSSQETTVILIGDSDLLGDRFCVQVQNFFGQTVQTPLNGNLRFVQNVIDQLADGLHGSLLPDLISAKRWWRFAQRPPIRLPAGEALDELTRSVTNLLAMPVEEGRKVLNSESTDAATDGLHQFEKQATESRTRLSELQAGKSANESAVLSAAQQQVMVDFRAMEAAYKEESKLMRRYAQARLGALERLHGITNADSTVEAKELAALQRRPFRDLLATRAASGKGTEGAGPQAESQAGNGAVRTKLPFAFKAQVNLVTRGLFTFDSGMNPSPAGLTKPEGTVSNLTLGGVAIALTDAAIKEGRIFTRDFGELEVYNGPTGLEFHGTESQKKAIAQAISKTGLGK